MFLRRAISKFKADFEEADLALRPDVSSIRTTSDDASRYSRSLNEHDLPPIPVATAESPNNNESDSPLQKRSLLQSLQHNSPNNDSLPSISIDSNPSTRDKSQKLTPILGSAIPIDPMNQEFATVSTLLNTSKKKPRSSSSSNDSGPSIVSATHSTEPYQPNSFMAKALLSDSNHKESKISTLFASHSKKPNGARAHHDTVNDLGQVERVTTFLTPLNASSTTTNGNAVPSTSLPKEIPNSLSHTSEVHEKLMETIQPPVIPHHGHNEPTESIQPTVIQAPQQSRGSSPYDDSVIPTISTTVINDNDNKHQHIPETTNHLNPTSKTQPLPFTSNKLSETEVQLNPFIKRDTSIPGDFPLDDKSTSSSVQSPPVKLATKTDVNPTVTSPKDNHDKKESKRKPSSSNMSQFLIAIAAQTPQAVSTEVPAKVEQPKTSWKSKRSLQPIGESSDSSSPNSSSLLSPGDVLYKKMEELGAMRRMESRSQLSQSKAGPEVPSQQPSQTTRTVPISKSEIRPQLQAIQEDNASDVAAMLREAYAERQRDLQTQLDKALAELQGLRADNKRLTNENQSQQRSITQLKSELDEAKTTQENSSVKIKNQLRDATSSLIVLTKEKKGWQEKLDSMQHKLNVAERQVRCLDHLTRHKLESRQELAYGLPKRRGQHGSVQASTDIIGAMRALNEEIYQACVQLVSEGLERTSTHSDKHKLITQGLLGNRLTAMMEDQATKTTPDYDVLLMQSVLEVFMAHWCSSIIEAFYPKQESFADLLVHLSGQTAKTSSSTAICGKQIQIVQPSTPASDTIKFNEWVKDIVKELGLVLMVGGMRMKTQRAPRFSAKILALVKLAHDLRTAMAEKDICGGLEVVVVPPDTPFQEKWMMDAHADPRKGDTDHSHVDFVVGTSGIGLQRTVSEKVDGYFQSRIETNLKPKVILARALNVKD